MPRILTAIRVTIGLKPDGHHNYPEFNRLPIVQQAGIDWSYYVDQQGLSWHYDHCCGHKVNAPESPFGMQFGVLVIPEEFAIQAIGTFPEVITRLTEAELEEFYNTHAHGHESETLVDQDVLNGLKLLEDRGIELTEDQLKALDPNDKKPGISKNQRRYWKDFRAEVDVEIR